MPSQKQSKRRRQVAKAPPPPPTRTARRQASPRVLIAAIVIIVLIVVAVVLGVVLIGGGSSSGSSNGSSNVSKLPDSADVQQLLAGIPQHGNVLGKPSAPVNMVEYIDLQCPYCQQFETTVMPSLISRYVRKGKLKVENRTVAFIGPDSVRGRAAALAAGDQNKQFNFMQLLYDNQGVENTGWLNDDMVKAAASSIPGLSVDRLLSDRNSSAIGDRASALDSEATAAGINKTPTVLVGKTGATPKAVALRSPTDEASVVAAIAAASR
jgi:protein-disulfide isomerase